MASDETNNPPINSTFALSPVFTTASLPFVSGVGVLLLVLVDSFVSDTFGTSV